jgi:TnpA family transposase
VCAARRTVFQCVLVHVNTLLMQEVLADPK